MTPRKPVWFSNYRELLVGIVAALSLVLFIVGILLEDRVKNEFSDVPLPVRYGANDSQSNFLHVDTKCGMLELDGGAITSAIYSTYYIVNRKMIYEVNDKIQVFIEARDPNGKPQTVGGAYFRAKLTSNDLKAASRSDGEITDFGNGTYRAEFVLRWPGRVSVMVMLIDGNGAIYILDRIRKEFPIRGSYIGRFKSGDIVETTMCNVDHVTMASNECDFTDLETGVPWFCVKPTNPKLECEHWWWHNSNNSLIFDMQTTFLRPGEDKFFSTFKQYLKCKNCSFDVRANYSKSKNVSWQGALSKRPPCLPGIIQRYDETTSGYYYKGTWYSTRCRNRKFIPKTSMQCLKNKTVLILGDSTARQIATYLGKEMKMEGLPSVDCMRHARKEDINFDLYDKFHGLPSRGSNGGPSKCLKQNVMHVLDHLDFTPDVLLLSVGAHYSIHTMELLRDRLLMIRDAVKRLLQLHPNTVFIIKSANTREFKTLSHILSNNEWYIYTLDRMVREMFMGFPHVALVDVWDMTVAQFDPDSVHPKRLTLSNIADLVLSYICPT